MVSQILLGLINNDTLNCLNEVNEYKNHLTHDLIKYILIMGSRILSHLTFPQCINNW